MKISNKSVVVGVGEICPHCRQPMSRKKHPHHWKPTKTFYYTEWDHCISCNHIQHYEEFKSADWKEYERQRSFLRNL